jgi:hypothetical protein
MTIYADFRKRLNPLFRKIKLQFIRYDDKKEMKKIQWNKPIIGLTDDNRNGARVLNHLKQQQY